MELLLEGGYRPVALGPSLAAPCPANRGSEALDSTSCSWEVVSHWIISSFQYLDSKNRASAPGQPHTGFSLRKAPLKKAASKQR